MYVVQEKLQGEPSLNLKFKKSSTGEAAGTFYTLIAFIMWGVLPGYWKQLNSVPALEIIYHRIVWSFLVSALFLLLAGRWHLAVEILKKRKLRFLVYITSCTIALNWLTYVYAINSGRIVEASLGYYINPLVNIFLGMVFLRERLGRLQICALILAICGVAYITFNQGSIPWIALTLAFSFGLYGLFKKTGNLDSVTSLTVETMILSLFAIPALFSIGFSGTGSFGGDSIYTDLFLAGSGIVSAVPLYLFASGAKAIPLTRVGFIQYTAPTISLFIGVLQYGESFTKVHAVSFGFIWAGLVIYTVSGFVEKR